jgi:hypothetical protein
MFVWSREIGRILLRGTSASSSILPVLIITLGTRNLIFTNEIGANLYYFLEFIPSSSTATVLVLLSPCRIPKLSMAEAITYILPISYFRIVFHFYTPAVCRYILYPSP